MALADRAGRRFGFKLVGQRAIRTRQIANGAAAMLAALDTALNAIDAPAIVVDLGGAVLNANSNARTLLERDRQGVARSLVRAIAGAPGDLSWELTPLRGAENRPGFLAILRAPRRDAAANESVRTAIERWHLTRRQAQVLYLVARGYTNALIADSLGIGEGTVEFHLSAIFDKAGVDNRATLMFRIMEL